MGGGGRGAGHWVLGGYLARRRARRQLLAATEADIRERGLPIPKVPTARENLWNWLMSRNASVASQACAGLFTLGAACFALAQWLPVFAPCRIEHRIHNAAQDSTTCQGLMALGLCGIVLLLLGAATLVVMACSVVKRRRGSGGQGNT